MILADKESIVQDLMAYGEFELAEKAGMLTEEEIKALGRVAARHIGKGGNLSKTIVLGAIEYFEGEYREPGRKRRDMSYYRPGEKSMTSDAGAARNVPPEGEHQNTIMMNIPLITRHPVAVFFFLTILISWGAILLIFGPGGIPATAELQQQIGMTILLGPVVAGLLLIFLTEGARGLRALGKRLARWRVGAVWYAVALLTAPLSTVVAVLLLQLFVPGHRPAILGSPDASGLLVLGIVGGLTVGLCEELGWTGFATPRMGKKHMFLYTGAIIGLVWGAWHFILFWEDDTFSGTLPFLLLLARLFSWLPAYRILMVWVHEHTRSLFVVILMHAALVASLATLDPVIGGRDLLAYIVIRAAVLWALVAVVAVAAKRKDAAVRAA